jgi:hypothetical protein
MSKILFMGFLPNPPKYVADKFHGKARWIRLFNTFEMPKMSKMPKVPKIMECYHLNFQHRASRLNGNQQPATSTQSTNQLNQLSQRRYAPAAGNVSLNVVPLPTSLSISMSPS